MKCFERHLVRCLGLLGEKIKRRTSPPILTYHSIDESGSIVSVSPEDFHWQMRYLKEQQFQATLLQDYIRTSEEKEATSERAVVITFDDGFKNVHHLALPVMQRYGFVGTVFVPTAYVGKTPEWEMEPGLPKLPLMDWKELNTLLENGFDIQSHTNSHRCLASLEASEIRKEIVESCKAIEDNLNHEANLLAYPYGEYSESAIDELKKAGFIGAVTIEFGVNSSRVDPFRLKRIGSPHFSEPFAFRACIWGMYGTLLTTKKRLKRPSSRFRGESPI